MSDEPDYDIERETAAAKVEVRASKLQGPMAVLAAAFLTVDFFVPRAMDGAPSEFLAAVILGILPAQFGVLAVMAVVGPGRWLLRQAATTALAAFGWLAVCVGLGVFANVPAGFSEEWFRFTALVPLVFLAVQMPLWIGRWLRGWRLVEAAAAATADRREARRFSMSDLLLMPVVVAVPLALSRLYTELAGGVAANLMVAAILSLASSGATLPCLLSAFRSRSVVVGFSAVACYSIGLGMALDALAMTFGGAPANVSDLSVFPLFILSMLAAMHGSLALIRRAGYVLLPVAAKRAEG